MQQSHLHNLLVEGLPNSVKVRSKEYRVNTDFRHWIAFEELAASMAIEPTDKAARMLNMCFSERVPVCREAFEALLTFYQCGKAAKNDGGKTSLRQPVLSYAHDSEYIIAAFQKEYGIDLTNEKLHWWRFSSLLKGLGNECRLSEIMKYRAADLSQIKDKKQREFYKRMKVLYALPDTRTEQEKEKYMVGQLEKLF